MKARKIQSRAARAPMFSRSSIGTAVAMALIAAASGAQAAETSVDAAYNGTATGTPSVNAGTTNSANVNATITGATVGTTSTGTPSNPNPVAVSTSGNLIGATATGNSFGNGIQAAPGLPVNNAATLGVATNTGVIGSSVTGSKLASESSTLQSGSVVNADNTISATTTLNSGSSVISGAAAVAAPAQAGTSVLTYPAGAPLFDAKGNIVVTSLQSAIGTGSSATVLGNTVDLMLTANAGNTLTTAASLERNSISAVLKANSASSTAEIQSGGAPTFAGSAVVANLQANGNGILATRSATNIGSVVVGIVSGAPAGGSNVLQGSLSVQGNAISSAATGNEALGAAAGVAGNRIVVDDVSVAGSGTAATAANNSMHNGAGVTSNVNSDLAIVNSQGNLGVTTVAQTMGAQILAGVQSSKNSAVTLADNSITATVAGNTASSSIATGKNAASFTGTTAVSNQQANLNAPVSALLLPSVIAAQTGESPGTGQTTGSSVSVSDNTSAASAQGNQITQSLALQAGTVALGTGNATLTGGTNSDGRVSASGSATLTNLQGNYAGGIGGVAAANVGSQIWLTANGGGAAVGNSTLSLDGNRQEAVALGSGATNTLTLSGNSVGTGAGIASVQMNDANSAVGAGLSNPEARLTVNGNLAGGSASLTDNLQRAISYGNSAANTLGVNAGNVAAAPGLGITPASSVTVDALSGLPFSNAAGALPTVSAAYGVLNDQSVQANVNSAATGPNTFAAAVAGNVSAASVANSGNAFVAAAYGNDAASGVTLNLNNVSGANASVANVTNTQAVAGAGTGVSAIAAGGVVARTTVTGTLADGSVTSSGNTAEALAYGSRATGNTVKVTGNNIDTSGVSLSGATLTGNTLATNAAFSAQNAQSGQGSVSAQRSGGPEVNISVGGAVGNSRIDATGNATLAGATSNSANSGVAVDAVGVATTTAVQNLQLTSAAVSSLTGQEGALLTNKDGVQVVLGGASIVGSQVTVDGNSAGGSATGNAAANRIDVKGNTIALANGLPLAGATSVGGIAGAVADHALSNIQLVTSPTISSKVAAAFGVDTAPGAVIAGSTLSASNNTQSAKAVANTGSNAIALAATDVSARSALMSSQGSAAAVEARSFMQAFAPASVSGSSVKLSNNANTALGVVNDVDNKLGVAGGTSSALPAPALIGQGPLPGNTIAAGDQVLVNRQSAGASVTSTADTAIYNEDRLVLGNAGLASSSFTASGNTTYSEAAANRATNAALLAGGASQSAKTAVLNAQDSSAAVTANANNATKLTLTGPTALAGSSAALDGNVTTAAATGSAATNSIDVKGGAIVGGLPASATATGGTASSVAASADHALANVQVGAGAVSATATGSIGIDSAPLSSVNASTLGVTNNSQSAKAVGNTALNSVTLAGSNVGARSVLQSSQSGTAAVTASSTLEVFAPAGSTGSTVRLSGNGNAALGVMNDAANTLSVSAVNTQPAGATGSATLGEIGGSGNITASGDHVLSNRQTAASTVSSTAATSIHNDDNAAPTTTLANGALTISGNSTFAEATANRATNTATVASSATQGASAGILNVQGSTAGVTATSNTVANATLSGVMPLNGSSISLDGNTTAALARGNAATNVLESGAGSSYGGAAAAGTSSLVGAPLALNVGASAAILNSQNNAGTVTAASTGTSYQVALNGTVGGVPNGTAGVTGNTLAAQAFGNSATNRVTQTALNTGAPSAAIGNYQVNTGAVTATVTSVNFGVGISGPVGNSTLRTTGNQITASATGNSAVSTISSR
ncbi:S-layer family protein [Variovorax atrisoli]|uniref:beta strand repeat-containing protein n=1 Tax=Variovorax atrisoli TaxID=3394203 RepID=UPI000F7DFB9B|nr:S-layer family protein [Variovorax sp. 369]RTD84658.1 S-layer family protein [Variovorax sp. 369]